MNNISTICLNVILQTRDIVRWGLPDSVYDTDAAYKQLLCSNDLFCSLSSELVCIISGYTQCDFYRISSAAMIYLTSKNFVNA